MTMKQAHAATSRHAAIAGSLQGRLPSPTTVDVPFFAPTAAAGATAPAGLASATEVAAAALACCLVKQAWTRDTMSGSMERSVFHMMRACSCFRKAY